MYSCLILMYIVSYTVQDFYTYCTSKATCVKNQSLSKLEYFALCVGAYWVAKYYIKSNWLQNVKYMLIISNNFFLHPHNSTQEKRKWVQF